MKVSSCYKKIISSSLFINFYIYFAMMFFQRIQLWSVISVPFYTSWGGLNLTLVQVLSSVSSLSIFFLEIPTGIISDVLGRKYSLILSSLFHVLGTVFYAIIPNFYLFLLSELMLACSRALYSGANEAYVYDSLKQIGKENQSKQFFGTLHSLFMVSNIVSAFIGTWLTKNFTYREIVLFTAIPSSIAFLLSLFLKRIRVNTCGKEVNRFKSILSNGYKNYFKNPKLVKYSIDAILVHIPSYFLLWFYQSSLLDFGVDVKYFGFFSVTLFIIQLIISNNYDTCEKIFGGESDFLNFSSIITMIGFMFVLIFNHWLAMIFCLILSGGFGLTRMSYYSAIMNREIDGECRASVNGFINMFSRLLIAFLGPLIGIIADINLKFIYLIFIIFILLGLLIKRKSNY